MAVAVSQSLWEGKAGNLIICYFNVILIPSALSSAAETVAFLKSNEEMINKEQLKSFIPEVKYLARKVRVQQ